MLFILFMNIYLIYFTMYNLYRHCRFLNTKEDLINQEKKVKSIETAHRAKNNEIVQNILFRKPLYEVALSNRPHQSINQ